MPKPDRTYTLEQIKKAYWKEFHKSGEWYFEYMDDEKTCEENTQSEWRDFEEALNE